MTNETRYILSAPAKSGYSETFTGLCEARRQAAHVLGLAIAMMVEIESPDGSTTYCYATQAEADADADGAYAVQYSAVA